VLAFTQDVYDTLKWVHIMAAIVWVGGGIFVQVYASRMRRAGEDERLAAFARDIEKLGNMLFLPASIVVLLMGISMVWYAPFIEWNDLWILLGLLGILSTALFGALFIGPEAGRLGKLSLEKGPADPEVQARIKRLFIVSRIDLAVIIFVIAMMVFKPGA
jgi:uncharacterized membrane protein